MQDAHAAVRERGAALLQQGLPAAAKELWVGWYKETVGDPLHQAQAANSLGVLEMLQRNYGPARHYFEEARVLAAAPGMPTSDRVKFTGNLALLAYTMGEMTGARELAQTALHEGMGLNDELILGHVYLTISAIEIAGGNWSEARRAAVEAKRHLDRVPERVDLAARALTNLGLVEFEEGRLDAAEQQLLASQELHQQHKDHSGMAHNLTEMGRLHFRRGDTNLALGAGRQALAILLADVSLLDREEVARLSLLFGTLHLARKGKGAALKYLNRAAAYFAQLGMQREWDEANRLTRDALALAGPLSYQGEVSEEERQLNYLTSILDLTDDIESVDEALRGHSERVASLALAIGRAVNLGSQQLQALAHAARLHDVGKVAGTDHHAETGERMARVFALPEECLAAIRHHHEQPGGRGEPDGLRGDKIPLLARIISVADAYDHLTSAPGESLAHSKTLEVLRGKAGESLDRGLVSALSSLHQQGKEVQV
ncbi:MAG: HD domain-containing phosphohydrolase [Symbiobacteriia bacterium]